MNLFNKKVDIEERSLNDTLIELFQNNSIYINEQSVLKIPVVAESINLIASSLAAMPIYLYQEKNGKIKRIDNDYRTFLLNEEHNEYGLSYDFKFNMVRDLLLYGKSYNYLYRTNRVEQIYPINFKTTSVKDIVNDLGIINNREVYYTLNNRTLSAPNRDFLIVDSGNKGILNSPQLLELLILHSDTLQNAMKNVAKPSGILQSKGRLTKDAVERLRLSWTQLYTGVTHVGKTVILEEGLEYKELSMDLSKLSMDTTKASLVEDVERLFLLDKVKNNDDLFLKRTLSGPIAAIENGINKALLLEKEKKQGYFFAFDTKELLKPSNIQQFEMYSGALKDGFMTVEEVRAALNLPQFYENDGLDRLRISLGACLEDKKGNVSVLNMATSVSSDGKAKQDQTTNGMPLGE